MAVLDEALALRDAGIDVPILVMGIVPPAYAQVMADRQIMTTVSELAWLEDAQTVLTGTEPLLVNLGVDTGMGRIGFRSRADLQEAIDFLQAHPAIFTYQGIMTHFAEADSSNNDYFHYQLDRWHELTDGMEMPPMIHVANSGAAMYHADEIPTDMVRAGTVVYGVEPSLGEVMPDDYLQPVFGLESELVFVKQMPADCGISYGHHYLTHQGEWIGTVPVGYGDGLPRALEGYSVLVNGEPAKIVGQIAMDQLMVSLPHAVPVGTKVTFVGQNGDRYNSLEAMSEFAVIAPWTLTTGLQERLRRELVD